MPSRGISLREIRTIKASGGTNFLAGVRLAPADKMVKAIVLLSDGEPTIGRFRTLNGLRTLLRKRKVRIHTVADEASKFLLKEIAKLTGGRRGYH